jgi:Uma2 family endonuclease
MTTPTQEAPYRTRWTTADLATLPDNGNRYEIIDGELIVSTQPHWNHQETFDLIWAALREWSDRTGLGRAVTVPGVIFGDYDNVVPDVVWISNERLKVLLDEAGHLTGAPELMVEVLSPGAQNEARDRQAKLKLYESRGVREYWIADWRLKQIEVYRRDNGQLRFIATLVEGDTLTSPHLPGFECAVKRLFPPT